MKATLIKVRSNHSNIGDKYTGTIGMLPKEGNSFVVYLDKEFHKEGLYLQTTPVLTVNKLNDKVIEFTTKHSSYSLELNG